MQFSCSTKRLYEGLQIATRAMANRTTNPLLEGVLLETENDALTITCTDERIAIVTRIPAQIIESGRGVVPGKLFFEIVRKLTDEMVNVSMDSKLKFLIKSASSKTNILGLDAALFPRLMRIESGTEISLPQDMLRDMIQKTEFAIAVEDMREVLMGALLEIGDGFITMVSLDGFRLALRKVRCSEVLNEVKAIIPGRALTDIGKLLSDNEEQFAELEIGSGKLHIHMDETDIYAVLIQGDYVQYRQILPSSFATKIELNVSELRACVERAALIAKEGSNNLIILRISDALMTLEAHSQIGDVHEEMEISKDGADLSIAFNVKYLLDVTRYIDAERIIMNFNSAVSPCIVTPSEDRDYLHLILPVRTSLT